MQSQDSSSPPTKGQKMIKVAIAGSGVGGLCLAIGLLKKNKTQKFDAGSSTSSNDVPLFDVHVYEAVNEFTDIGFGLAFHGNAIRAMEQIGPEVKQAYFDSAELQGRDEEEELATDILVAQGSKAHELVAFLGKAKGRKTVARADLLKAWLKLIPSDRVHFGKRIAHIDYVEREATSTSGPNSSIQLRFADGSSAEADCLIGADGIHSATRRFLLGVDHPATEAKPQPWVSFRRLVPMAEAKQAGVVDKWIKNVPIFCGQDACINSMPIHGGKTLSVSVVTPLEEVVDSSARGEEAKLENGAAVEGFKNTKFRTELFHDWIPEARTMIELVSKNPGDPWIFSDHDPAPSYHRGPIAMMGDAAHATIPFAGNGAAQAIEDAATLANLFQHVVTDLSHIPKALQAYDTVRRPRSQQIVDLSRMFGRLYAFAEPGVGDDLDRIRQKMGEAAWMNDADLEEQNRRALEIYKALL